MSSRLGARRRKRTWILLGCVAAVLIAIFLLCLWIANAAFLRITKVVVSGQAVIPAASIEAVAMDEMSRPYVGLFSKANILMYPKDTIKKNLLMLYPTLMSADIRAQDFHTIAISVSERTPHALWCGTDAATSSACVLLDTHGLAYANAPTYSGPVYNVYLGAIADGPLPKQFLMPERYHSLTALVDAFSKKIAPDTVTRIRVDTNDDVHLSTSGGYEIKFALQSDGGKVFQRFTLTLTAEPFKTHPLSDFEYIDLRFGDKVYYILKNK